MIVSPLVRAREPRPLTECNVILYLLSFSSLRLWVIPRRVLSFLAWYESALAC